MKATCSKCAQDMESCVKCNLLRAQEEACKRTPAIQTIMGSVNNEANKEAGAESGFDGAANADQMTTTVRNCASYCDVAWVADGNCDDIGCRDCEEFTDAETGVFDG